jgi:CIC family chloride channel protein
MRFTEGRIRTIKNYIGRALLGGIGLTLIIFIFPPIYGEGYDTIKNLLTGNTQTIFARGIFDFSGNQLMIYGFLLLIIMIKPVATALTIGAGGSGGIFGPSLFIGGLTGFVFAGLVNLLMPGTAIQMSHFTLVGMCGLMSGILHAPLTAIFLIAEITSGYMLFVPLMLVSAISYITTSYFEKHSLYTKNLIERGDLIPYDKDRIVLSMINLKKLVEKDLLTIHPDATLSELVKLVKRSKRNIFPVVNEKNELEGIVTLDNIREIMFDKQKRSEVVVLTIMQRVPTSVSSTEKMQSVMSKFEITQAWNLPVIDDGHYIGFVSKSRIFNAYRTKLIYQSKE